MTEPTVTLVTAVWVVLAPVRRGWLWPRTLWVADSAHVERAVAVYRAVAVGGRCVEVPLYAAGAFCPGGDQCPRS